MNKPYSRNKYICDLIKNAMSSSLTRSDASHLLLKMSRQDIDKILDELTIMFCNEGLNADDEPNAMGLKLEEIIGLFSEALYNQ